MAIKNLKKVVYGEESIFKEAYDATAAKKEIKTADLDIKIDSVKLETTYTAIDGELSPTTSTGRKTGHLTFTKPIGKAALTNHEALIQAGLGQTDAQSNEYSVIVTKTSNKELISTEDFADGEIVFFDFDGAGGAGYSSFYVIDTFTTGTKVASFLTPINAVDYAKITATTTKMKSAKTITPAKTDFDKSFCFAVQYDDDSMMIFRGASLAITFEVVKEDKLVLNFDIMSAFAGYKDESGDIYTKVTGTITDEIEDNMVYADFKNSYVYDVTTSAEKEVCPYSYGLNIGHTLVKNEFLCGIKGWYSKPEITGEIEFSKTPANEITFDEDNEANANNFLFFSQENFAIYAEHARLTNANLGAMEEFDTIMLNTDVNHSTTKKLRIVFPQ